MKLSKNEIIVLENNKRYVLLENVEYLNEEFFLAMGILDNNEVIQDEVIFLKYTIENNSVYISKIKNQSLIDKLTKLINDKNN